MKLTVFPKINLHPKNKQEKEALSKLSSKPHLGEEREFNCEEELFELITSYGWSPSIFTGYRNNANFSFCDVLALDVDNDLTIEEAELICQNNKLSALISPSPSFTPELHKFRVVFPLARRISTAENFTATWQKLASIFPVVDEQCKDMARFFFPCKPDFENTVWVEGDLLEPVEFTHSEKGIDSRKFGEYNFVSTDGLQSKDALKFVYGEVPEKVPESVAKFFENAHTGMEGEWTNSLNACCFTLALQGVEEEKIWQVVEELAPYALDSNDIYQIERAVKDGSEAREDRK